MALPLLSDLLPLSRGTCRAGPAEGAALRSLVLAGIVDRADARLIHDHMRNSSFHIRTSEVRRVKDCNEAHSVCDGGWNVEPRTYRDLPSRGRINSLEDFRSPSQYPSQHRMRALLSLTYWSNIESGFALQCDKIN